MFWNSEFGQILKYNRIPNCLQSIIYVEIVIRLDLDIGLDLDLEINKNLFTIIANIIWSDTRVSFINIPNSVFAI